MDVRKIALLVGALLVAAVTGRSDFDSLEPMGSSFVDAALREKRADLLYRARVRGEPG